MENYTEKSCQVNNAKNLALTGSAFNYVLKNYKADKRVRVLQNTKVYARMTPVDKQTLISNLQKITPAAIGMCGDGANDCAAL